MSQMIADLPTPDKIFSHEFTLVGLETGLNLMIGAIYVIYMLQKCVSLYYVLYYFVKVLDSYLTDMMDCIDWEERNN